MDRWWRDEVGAMRSLERGATEQAGRERWRRNDLGLAEITGARCHGVGGRERGAAYEAGPDGVAEHGATE